MRAFFFSDADVQKFSFSICVPLRLLALADFFDRCWIDGDGGLWSVVSTAIPLPAGNNRYLSHHLGGRCCVRPITHLDFGKPKKINA